MTAENGVETGGSPLVAQQRQWSETFFQRDEPLLRLETVTTETSEADGYDVINLFIRTTTAVEVRVFEGCTCDGLFVQTATYQTTVDPTGTLNVLNERHVPVGAHVFFEIENIAAGDQTRFDACFQALPIAGPTGAGGGGSGSPGGPGSTIATLADVTVPAATETPVVTAADIPAGTRTMTLVNTGAAVVRIKGAGEGGGATRGTYLVAAGGSVTFGGDDGALAPVDAFSTAGSSVSVTFERN